MDLSQYAALLAEHSDDAIAGVAGCSVEAVAAFRAQQQPKPQAEPPPADPPKRAPARPKPEAPAPAPAPPPPPPSVASYVAALSLEDAEALYKALQERLHPPPAEQPAPRTVKVLANVKLTGPNGQPAVYNRGDHYSGEIAAHLWHHHREHVRAYPS